MGCGVKCTKTASLLPVSDPERLRGWISLLLCSDSLLGLKLAKPSFMCGAVAFKLESLRSGSFLHHVIRFRLSDELASHRVGA